jgi:hypothetical protein
MGAIASNLVQKREAVEHGTVGGLFRTRASLCGRTYAGWVSVTPRIRL